MQVFALRIIRIVAINVLHSFEWVVWENRRACQDWKIKKGRKFHSTVYQVGLERRHNSDYMSYTWVRKSRWRCECKGPTPSLIKTSAGPQLCTSQHPELRTGGPYVQRFQCLRRLLLLLASVSCSWVVHSLKWLVVCPDLVRHSTRPFLILK